MKKVSDNESGGFALVVLGPASASRAAQDQELFRQRHHVRHGHALRLVRLEGCFEQGRNHLARVGGAGNVGLGREKCDCISKTNTAS